jgi:hypothetical protein
VSLFRRDGNQALVAFANEQIKAATEARSGVGASAADLVGWAPLGAMAEQLFTAVRRACTLGQLDATTTEVAPVLRVALIHQQETMAASGKRRVTRIDSVTSEPFGGQVFTAADRTVVVRFKVAGGLGEATLGDDLDAQLAVLPTRTWFEIWRLARPADASPVEPAATCSNCGAPSNGLTTCAYCGTSLVKPATDYAVNTIEWLA